MFIMRPTIECPIVASIGRRSGELSWLSRMQSGNNLSMTKTEIKILSFYTQHDEDVSMSDIASVLEHIISQF